MGNLVCGLGFQIGHKWRDETDPYSRILRKFESIPFLRITNISYHYHIQSNGIWHMTPTTVSPPLRACVGRAWIGCLVHGTTVPFDAFGTFLDIHQLAMAASSSSTKKRKAGGTGVDDSFQKAPRKSGLLACCWPSTVRHVGAQKNVYTHTYHQGLITSTNQYNWRTSIMVS